MIAHAIHSPLAPLPHRVQHQEPDSLYCHRADAIIAFWPTLPEVLLPAGTTGPFSFSQDTTTVTLAVFTARRDAATAANDGIPTLDQAFQKVDGELGEQLEILEDFAQVAISTGTDQFDEGTAEREQIDAIPNSPPQALPLQGELGVTPGDNKTADFTFAAPGATSFDFYQRILPDGEWILLLEDVIEDTYHLDSQPDGDQEYKVLGRNARGAGPASDVATLHYGREGGPPLAGARSSPENSCTCAVFNTLSSVSDSRHPRRKELV